MDILIIGSRGREHALALQLKKDPRVGNLFCIPGNGGLAGIATCIQMDVTDFEGIAEFLDANPNIELTIVNPDESLYGGLVELLQSKGHRAFGCCAAGAKLECDKRFSRYFCEKYNIPAPSYKIFSDYHQAKKYAQTQFYPLVVKTNGRTAGKGILFCRNPKEAENSLYDIMITELFGDAGKTVDIEEFVPGEKVIVTAFTDGNTIYPLPAVNNYKRVFDGDYGMSTAGMGASMPARGYTPEVEQEVREKIFTPLLDGLKREGIDYRGIIGFSLIITDRGVKVVDFVSRMCDVESQILIPQIQTPVLDIINAVIDGKLAELGEIQVKKENGICIVATSGGYPLEYTRSLRISIGNLDEDVSLFHAGTKIADGELRTSGGRVVTVACWGNDLQECIDKAYRNMNKVQFENMHFRHDIGTKIHNTDGVGE